MSEPIGHKYWVDAISFLDIPSARLEKLPTVRHTAVNPLLCGYGRHTCNDTCNLKLWLGLVLNIVPVTFDTRMYPYSTHEPDATRG
ncbi:hypothetical protein TNCV_4988541 [Trichonephila clavipes]|nr:hypothetical protein TNCV_4988541 [Trichonephila clavipes]